MYYFHRNSLAVTVAVFSRLGPQKEVSSNPQALSLCEDDGTLLDVEVHFVVVYI